jgi:hypothetical protein
VVSVQPILLNSFTHWTKWFQDRPLLNRAVLDTAGYAAPSIALTRDPVERKEQTLDRILVIGSAFFLAPRHFMRCCFSPCSPKGCLPGI